jgi:chemotaxis protein methyltransferase CheR
VLNDVLGDSPWEVLGSDLSTRVLEQARNAHYLMERAKDIPEPMLRKYCLKGVGSQAGTFVIQPQLRKRVSLRQIKLHAPIPAVGQFDVIYLRNVMIYFNSETKREVVARLLPSLKRGGHFIIGHSETLNGLTELLTSIAPSVYCRSRMS